MTQRKRTERDRREWKLNERLTLVIGMRGDHPMWHACS